MLPKEIDKIVSLKKGEEILGSYGCHLDFVKGYAVLTSDRLLFIEGGGGFDEKYIKSHEIPYKDIKEITSSPGDTVLLKVSDHPYRYRLDTLDVSVTDLKSILISHVH